MKNYELLELIGEAGEDYVLEADSDGERPRFRWKAWAAAAACAALVLCAYPVYKTAALPRTTDLNASPSLHAYTVVEGIGIGRAESSTAAAGGVDGAAGEQDALPAPAGGGSASYPEANTTGGSYDASIQPFTAPAGDAFAGAAVEPDAGGKSDAAVEPDPTPDPAPEDRRSGIPTTDQRTAIAQYQSLCRACGLEDNPPEWYAGAWLDNDRPDHVARLAVSIVEGFHTPELEARIEDWCGGEVLFVQDMKYPYARLLDMLEQINQALAAHLNRDGIWSALTSIRPDMMGNCLEVNFYGLPSDGALAFLAQLDPEGDAIRVQAFTDPIAVDDAGGPPSPGPAGEPTPTPTPAVEDLPQSKQGGAG